jgi:glycosyltransferase involved in cell wall biosynthesis
VQSLAASDIPTHFNPDFMIGTCCRIAPVKRIEWLINVLYILNKKIPDATLTIVGGVHPKQNNYWETLAQKIYELGIENIYFPGQVGNVFPYLRKFKVFIMVSEPGGCPNASLEAMVAGLPIVATRFGGALDQIEHEVNGYLVSSYDPQDMAERVEYLLRNPQRLKEMGQEAFRKVSQDFSINSMVSKYIDIFNEV